jgi:hypothetical protein
MAQYPEKKLLNIKSVFSFSLQLLSEILHILRKTQHDIRKMYTGLHVEYQLFLSDLNQNLIFSQFSKKSLNIKFHENMSSGSPLVPCRWTDRQTNGRTDVIKLKSHFSQFCIHTNKSSALVHYCPLYLSNCFPSL